MAEVQAQQPVQARIEQAIEQVPGLVLVGSNEVDEFDLHSLSTGLVQRINNFAAPKEPTYRARDLNQFGAAFDEIFEPGSSNTEGGRLNTPYTVELAERNLAWLRFGVRNYREHIGTARVRAVLDVPGLQPGDLSEEIVLFRAVKLTIYPNTRIAYKASKGWDYSTVHVGVTSRAKREWRKFGAHTVTQV